MELADFWPTRILLTAAELEIFNHLGEPVTAAAVAQECNLDVRGVTRLLDALVALEILNKMQERYQVAPGLQPSLLPGPECIVPAIKHRAVLWRSWSKLPEVVRTGRPAVDPYENDERPEADVRSFIGAMAVGGRKQAPVAVAALDLGGVRTVLDIGGGPGVYAAEFCKASPDIRAVMLDFPRVCEIARENLAGTEYADRVSFVEGEARTVGQDAVIAASGGQGFDLVFTSSLIHSMSSEQVMVLFERAVSWTANGGQLVVKDFFMDASRTRPSRGAIFSVNMLVNTPGGASYTWDECERWLRDACASQQRELAGLERIVLGDEISSMVAVKLGG